MLRRGARFLSATIAVAAVALLVGSAALAASPRQIYADFADNGRLDAQYSQADLQAVLKNATLGGYEDAGTVGRMKTEIKRKAATGAPAAGAPAAGSPAAGAPAGTQDSLRATGSAGALPFTGFDLALIVGGALFLLVVGGGLRRVARARS
jgi:hypothetical protein